jgi:serine/threonine protein kinase
LKLKKYYFLCSANILVTKDGVIKLADFGIATVAEAKRSPDSKLSTLRNPDEFKDLTYDTAAVGSPHWSTKYYFTKERLLKRVVY